MCTTTTRSLFSKPSSALYRSAVEILNIKPGFQMLSPFPRLSLVSFLIIPWVANALTLDEAQWSAFSVVVLVPGMSHPRIHAASYTQGLDPVCLPRVCQTQLVHLGLCHSTWISVHGVREGVNGRLLHLQPHHSTRSLLLILIYLGPFWPCKAAWDPEMKGKSSNVDCVFTQNFILNIESEDVFTELLTLL